MGNFIKQIEEDIKEYQLEYSCIDNIKKDEWAFNYWVLDKLFYEDNELIEEKIIDYRDMGVDAYEIYEDTKEIYLIQNKYYRDNSRISAEYVKNDFLIRSITALENGTYNKSEELQSFFTKYRKDDDFTVYFQLFVTNNNHSKEADEYIKVFNREHPKYQAKIFYLEDIESRYFGESEEQRKQITVSIESVNKSTILNINSDSYKLANVIDARYVFTPVVSLYRIYRESIEKGYLLFEKNIREYLGNTGINKNIYKTLLDPKERQNFFYYNNGITIICDKMHKIETKNTSKNLGAVFNIENPQIVNGCQTVNSIYQALNNVSPENLENDFSDTFVMLKILEIDRDNIEEEDLYRNIVKYNNSQNAIDEKTFAANSSEFLRIQNEFEKKGFLLLIKQSDKNTYRVKYKTITKLKEASQARMKKFGLNDMKKISDFFIPLEKLLQIINAFKAGGEIAYKNKSNMLKFNSQENKVAVEFIKSTTIEVLLELYMLYKRAEQEKKYNSDSRYPIPYYLIDGFAKYECDGRKSELISESLRDQTKIQCIIKLYLAVTKAYTLEYSEKNKIDYNKMIKRPIDYKLFHSRRETLKPVICDLLGV